MNPEWTQYRVGDLVFAGTSKVPGLVTKSKYWALDEYLGGEIECIDVMFGGHESKQYPVQYLEAMP